MLNSVYAKPIARLPQKPSVVKVSGQVLRAVRAGYDTAAHGGGATSKFVASGLARAPEQESAQSALDHPASL
jgi:hypothetical protein